MKITKSKLKQIIKEELESVLNENSALAAARAADASAAPDRKAEEQKIISNAKLADYKQRALIPYFNREWKKLAGELSSRRVTPQGLEQSAEQLVDTFYKPWDNMQSSLGHRYKFVQASKNELLNSIYAVIYSKAQPGGTGGLLGLSHGKWLDDAIDKSYTILGGVGHRGEKDAKEARVVVARQTSFDRKYNRAVGRIDK